MNALHILVVDDDVITSHALKEHFERNGYRVTLADGCQEAKEVLSSASKVDLMILDYLMPDGHGTDLIRSLAEEAALQKPRIIMCSSLIDPNNPAWRALCSRIPFGLQSLIRAYISKPYTFTEMDPMVSSILASNSDAASNELLSGDYQDPSPQAKNSLPTSRSSSK